MRFQKVAVWTPMMLKRSCRCSPSNVVIYQFKEADLNEPSVEIQEKVLTTRQ